jgi:hypothetical protein
MMKNGSDVRKNERGFCFGIVFVITFQDRWPLPVAATKRHDNTLGLCGAVNKLR